MIGRITFSRKDVHARHEKNKKGREENAGSSLAENET
jgi:hypothetical protein